MYQSHDFNGTPSSFALNVHNYIQEIRTKMKNIKIMIKKDIMIPMEYINKQSYDKLVSLNSKVQPLERSILLLINQTTLTT